MCGHATGSGRRGSHVPNGRGGSSQVRIGSAGRAKNFTTHALPGDPAKALLTVANEVGADLIVVGNKGMKGKGRFPGSVPNDIAHQAPCDVLVVRST